MTAGGNMVLILLIPLFGALLTLLLSRWPNLREAATLLTAALLFLVVLQFVPDILAGSRPTVVLGEFLPGLGLTLTLEPLGLLFALIASGLWFVTTIYSIGYMRGNSERHQTRFYLFFAVSLAAVMGIALSGNMLTLFIFYEVLTLATYPLVTHKGDTAARRGGRIYLGLLLGTSIGLLLLAMLWTWHATGTLDFRDGGILRGHLSPGATTVLLGLYMFGIGKAALMPFHSWLPAAMVAPTPVSALLHAVAVVKAGVFTIVKVIIYIFGTDYLGASVDSDWLIYIAGATILIASVVALQQDNLKARLAWSTISQLSYIILAAALLAPLSILAAVLHIAAHACGKITLFFAAGSIYTASHKTRVSELDGIGRKMPWTMAAFAIGSLSMIGLPPTAGFISKWYLLMGAWQTEQQLAFGIIILSSLLNAAYFLPIVYAAFLKRPADAGSPEAGSNTSTIEEAPMPIVIALMMTSGLTLLMFIWPAPLLNLARALPL